MSSKRTYIMYMIVQWYDYYPDAGTGNIKSWHMTADAVNDAVRDAVRLHKEGRSFCYDHNKVYGLYLDPETNKLKDERICTFYPADTMQPKKWV